MEDIYVYDGTNVLINKRNIRSNEELDQFENAMTSLAIININRNFEFKDLNDIYKIHKALFENVYDWVTVKNNTKVLKEASICQSEEASRAQNQEDKKGTEKDG